MKKYIYLALILIIVFACFYPSLNSDYTNWDDNKVITDNKQVQSLDIDNLKNIFSSTIQQIYVPLSVLSLATEYHFFGYNSFVTHLINLLFHLFIVALIFYFAQQLGLSIYAAFFAALLFGIHPMHVESVVWATERKDVLYVCFYMLSLIFYLKYLDHRKRDAYLLSILFGILSILSKPMALSLPLVFFVLDFFRKRKFNKEALLDKIPHFIYIAPIVWITYSLHARIPGKDVSQALLILPFTAAFYIKKFALPLFLSPLYVLPKPISILNPHYFLAIAFIVLFMFIAFYF
ncbi:MAG: hypothetical protein P9X22_03595, partial [Candidatus Zapsychrus exili]|nr:hypothetical protein [Candidatus Zapsychrus exili]